MYVYFCSNRKLGRCENLTAVYNGMAHRNRYFFRLDSDEARRIFREAGPNNIIVTDEFPLYSTKATVIMLLHGPSGGKTYGLDQRWRWHSELRAPTYTICSSDSTRELISKCSGTPIERVLPLGFPRTDAYIGKKKGDGGTGFEKFERVYLYVPTFRNGRNGFWLEPDWEWLIGRLKPEELFVVKRHMIMGKPPEIPESPNLIEVPASEISTPYLIDSDVVITDYSSILFDAHILGKPVVLYDYDRDLYLATRGMYYEYPSGYASRETQNWKQLLKVCREADKPGEEDLRCLEKSCGRCDGHSTDRVVELIDSLIEKRSISYDTK